MPIAFRLALMLPALLSGADGPDAEALARVRAEEAARVQLVERLSPAVVCIFPKGHRNGGGSGVLISADGLGLTNYHVVASLGAARQGEGGLADGKLYPLEVLGIDPAGDVAMFRLTRTKTELSDVGPASRRSATGETPVPQDRAFPFVPLGDSDSVRAGDWALAMGNPFLLAEDYTPTVTFGIVSGNHRYLAGQGRALIYTDCIEIATSINPGNSGGPLFNMKGELIGINGRIGIEERGRVNVGVGYAIGINQIKRFIPALRAGLVTKHATLGATVFDKAFRDVMVDQILDTSDAYRAGLRLADRVTAINGREIHSANALLNVVGSLPAEWPVSLTIRRDEGGTGVPPVYQDLRFRLEALPLPKQPRLPREMQAAKLGPLAGDNEDANIAEVRRRLAQARGALCGTGVSPVHADAAAAPPGWSMRYTRTLVRTGGASEQVSQESRDAAAALDKGEPLEPGAAEVAARWSLLHPPASPRRSDWKIIGVDEVEGRLCVVLQRTCDNGLRLRFALEDATGELLRLSFDDAKTGKAVRYDYADYRDAGSLRLPHRRTLYLDGERFAEDVIEKYSRSAGVTPK